jgi:hypothetical protein
VDERADSGQPRGALSPSNPRTHLSDSILALQCLCKFSHVSCSWNLSSSGYEFLSRLQESSARPGGLLIEFVCHGGQETTESVGVREQLLVRVFLEVGFERADSLPWPVL